MKLHILFGHRRESYKGEHNPEPLICWSEYEVEENPEGFAADVERTLATRGKEFERTQLFAIRVSEVAIIREMYEVPEIDGTLTPPVEG